MESRSEIYINFEYYISTTYPEQYRVTEKITEYFQNEIKNKYPILPENPEK